jgi:hypothetical protein
LSSLPAFQEFRREESEDSAARLFEEMEPVAIVVKNTFVECAEEDAEEEELVAVRKSAASRRRSQSSPPSFQTVVQAAKK